MELAAAVAHQLGLPAVRVTTLVSIFLADFIRESAELQQGYWQHLGRARRR